jgi:hypothetical protein
MFEGAAGAWTCSTEELCQLFGVSKVAVHYWRKDGMPQRARGVYDLGEVIRWWRERFSERAVADAGTEDEDKRALIQAQTRKYQVETLRLEGELIPREEVATIVHGLAALYRTALEGFGPRVAGELAELGDAPRIQEALVRECRDVLAQVSGRVTSLASEGFHDTSGGLEDPEAPAVPDRRRVGRRHPNSPAREPRAGALADG